MKEQLTHYVDLLFAGAADADDIRQEILQNTLDRYDDLIAQGKTPEAAYRLAISGIGDINEILGNPDTPVETVTADTKSDNQDEQTRKLRRAVAIGMYILSPIPLFILSEFGLDTMGLCFTLMLVAAATILIVLSAGKEKQNETAAHPVETVYDPQLEYRKSIRSVIRAVGLLCYFAVSIWTQAWFITWLIFPLISAVQGLANAILDLKEAR